MKLLHIADLHLDRSFEGLKFLPDYLAQRLQTANKQVLHKLIDIALLNQVDAVIFAGDTFHQSRTSIQTQNTFFEGLQRLIKENIHVIISFGNHDYYDKARYWFDFPEGVHLFETEEVTTHYFVTKSNERVAVSGFSYVNQWIDSSKLPEFPVKAADADIHIGVYHGEVYTDHQSRFAPFSLNEMRAVGYDYWALGHIHQPQVMSARPLIVYPGTPQGHTKKERDVQGAALVTLQDGHGTVHFEKAAEVSWEQRTYSLTECRSKREVRDFLETELLRAASNKKLFCLSDIHLKDSSHLEPDFFLACENGELLEYLQQKLNNQKEKIFVFNLTVQEQAAAEKLFIQADPLLLEQLEMNYIESAEIFAEETGELLQNPIFSGIQGNDYSWRKSCVEQADQRMKEYFTIQEDLT